MFSEYDELNMHNEGKGETEEDLEGMDEELEEGDEAEEETEGEDDL